MAKRSNKTRTQFGAPFAEWTSDRNELGPFLDLDAEVAKGDVMPDYGEAIMGSLADKGETLSPWIVEDDCQTRSPWGQLFDLDLLPPGVKEKAQRCATGSPWRTVREDLGILATELQTPEYASCPTRLDQLARYNYARGALIAATGKGPDRPWEAEIDFFGRCVTTVIDRPSSESEDRLLEFDGAALDQREAERARKRHFVRNRDELIFQKANRGDPSFKAAVACGNLVHGLLDEAEASGALEAERVGPNDPPGGDTPDFRSDVRTLAWCLRAQPRMTEVPAERLLLEMETEIPEETRIERVRRAEREQREQRGSATRLPPEEPATRPNAIQYRDRSGITRSIPRSWAADRIARYIADNPPDEGENISIDGARGARSQRKTKKAPKRQRRR